MSHLENLLQIAYIIHSASVEFEFKMYSHSSDDLKKDEVTKVSFVWVETYLLIRVWKYKIILFTETLEKID